MKNQYKRVLTILSDFNVRLGLTLFFLGLIFVLIPSLPQIWYRIFPESTEKEITTIINSDDNPVTNTTVNDNELPPIDKALPKVNSIKISKIGVLSPLKNGENYEEILKRGSWMVNDFPTPDKEIGPVIIASHRFGYVTWSAKERKEISFYNLPKLKVGDTVEIVWNQRLYKYKIIKSSEGKAISDYNVDLILYTCKLYNSPIRIFMYAERSDQAIP